MSCNSWVMLRVYIFNKMPVPFRCLGLDLKMPEISQLAALLIDLVKECYFYYCKVLSTIAFKTWSIVLIRLNTRYSIVENILVSSSMTDCKKN